MAEMSGMKPVLSTELKTGETSEKSAPVRISENSEPRTQIPPFSRAT